MSKTIEEFDAILAALTAQSDDIFRSLDMGAGEKQLEALKVSRRVCELKMDMLDTLIAELENDHDRD